MPRRRIPLVWIVLAVLLVPAGTFAYMAYLQGYMGDALAFSHVQRAWGRVTGKSERGAYGIIELEIGLKDQNGKEGSPGTAVVVVPLKGGPKVPYPFNPAALN